MGKNTTIKGRPKPDVPKGGYTKSKRRYAKGGKLKTKS